MGNQFQIPFRLGTWAALAAFAYFVLVWLTPFSPLGYARLGGFWIPVVFIFLAVYRQKNANGTEGFPFRDAFLTGMMTAFVLGAVKGLLVYMCVEFVDYSIVSKSYEENIRVLEFMKGVTPNPQELDEQIDALRKRQLQENVLLVGFNEIYLYLLGGLPLSLLAALIFNRNPKHV